MTTGSKAPNARLFAAALCAAFFAGCSAASLTPSTSRASDASRPAAPATSTTLRVIVYPTKTRPRPQSLTFRVDGEPHAKTTIALRPAAGICKRTAAPGGLGVLVLQCAVAVEVKPGTHPATVTTQASGKTLSINRLFLTIADCAPNDVNLALNEHTASIAVSSEDPNVERRPGGYFAPFGSGTFDVTNVDAYGNTIVGPEIAVLAVLKSSDPKIHALFQKKNLLAVTLDGGVPFDRMFRSRITLASDTVGHRFEFAAEFTTWPTVTPSPTPPPC